MASERQIQWEAARFYASWKSYHGYALGKLALDPAYPYVASRLSGSPRPLLDVGCGPGLLEIYVKLRGHSGLGIALDADEQKIRIARNALEPHLPDMAFLHGDARTLPEFSGDVVMLDVLHYLDPATQRQVLEAIRDRVAPGGVALIRIGLRQRNWRYFLTWMEEWLIRMNGWIPQRGQHFPTADDVLEPFRNAGWNVKHQPMWGWTPFNSYLFEMRRPD